MFTFPASMFKIKKLDRSYKTNYYEMFSDLRINKTFAEQVKLIRNNITYRNVLNIMTKIINSEQLPINKDIKLFWIEIVTLRYLCIINRVEFNKAFNIVETEVCKL